MSNNFKLVEGVWNQFLFKRIENADYEHVFEHIMKHFLMDEPTCKLLGWTDAFGKEMCEVVKIMLRDNLSFMALDKSTGKVAGVRITFSSKSLHLDELEIHEPQTDIFLNGIDLTVKQKDEILSQNNADSYAEFFISSTDPEYRNQGLAMEMYNRSIKFLKAEGFTLIKCIFTSDTSRRAANKLGFKEVVRIYYKDMLDKNGEFVFPRSKISDETCAVAMIKVI